ncbi:MAG TPA: hypothetical protein PKC59_13095, partial [Burkholderiaceae bacterium]|nr:hypothetical protein [Burkholderiaceae bacterium]
MLLRQALSQERTAHGDELLLPGAPTREQIVRFEELLLQAEAQGHGVELGTWHHFADGLVARTILIPAG